MSVRALSWALREAPVSNKSELLTLIVLCDHAHDDGDGAYPSVETIARMARLSERGAQTALRSLERAGLIEAKRRHGTTTVYRVVMIPACAPPGGAATAPPGGAATAGCSHCGVQPVVSGGAAAAPEPSEPSIETATQSLHVEDDRSPSPSDSTEGDGKLDTREIGELFAYWQQQCGHPQAKLSPQRRGRIAARLREGFTPEQLREAIDGAAKAAFVNEATGTRYDDCELIFRNASKVDLNIGRAQQRNGSGAGSGRRESASDLLRAMDDAAAARRQSQPELRVLGGGA